MELVLTQKEELILEQAEKTSPRFIAVVHTVNLFQVTKQAQVAYENGADGIFLINHDSRVVPWSILNRIFSLVRTQFRNEWIGINYLDLSAEDARRAIPYNADALWTDGLAPTEPLTHGKKRFSGVAFKGQPRVHDLFTTAQKAIKYTDVITTSGDRTGSPPTVEKVKIIRTAIGRDAQLAIASGMDARNVSEFAPYVDYVLVATGISKSFHEFDPVKICEFKKALSES